MLPIQIMKYIQPSGARVQLSNRSVTKSGTTTTVTAYWEANADGNVHYSGLSGDAIDYAWKLTGVVGDYDITFNGGSSWANLATTQRVSVSDSVFDANDVVGGPYDVRIRDKVTLAVLASCTVNLDAQKTG